jgi:hypothetical protein
MNHPKREEWVPYLYGEAAPEDRQRLKAHLESCGECRGEIEGWKRSLGRLDAWKLPRARKADGMFVPLLKWAAAAVIVLTAGFGAGRLTAPRVDAGKLRAAVEPELRRQLSQELAQVVRDEVNLAAAATLTASGKQAGEMIAVYAKALEARRTEDSQAIHAALDRLASQRLDDFVLLKKDLDTVAVNTDAGLRQAEEQLVRLAGYTQPARIPKSSQQ